MSSKGYLPHQVIKALVFWILAFCIVAATAAGILQSWGTIGAELAQRCLWTAFMLACGSVGFLLINYLFGDLGQIFLGQSAPPPPSDPAFRERLRKAKVERPAAGGPPDAGATNP